jgi:hypothetical protein
MNNQTIFDPEADYLMNLPFNNLGNSSESDFNVIVDIEPKKFNLEVKKTISIGFKVLTLCLLDNKAIVAGENMYISLLDIKNPVKPKNIIKGDTYQMVMFDHVSTMIYTLSTQTGIAIFRPITKEKNNLMLGYLTLNNQLCQCSYEKNKFFYEENGERRQFCFNNVVRDGNKITLFGDNEINLIRYKKIQINLMAWQKCGQMHFLILYFLISSKRPDMTKDIQKKFNILNHLF